VYGNCPAIGNEHIGQLLFDCPCYRVLQMMFDIDYADIFGVTRHGLQALKTLQKIFQQNNPDPRGRKDVS
jgi:hypothetical protein